MRAKSPRGALARGALFLAACAVPAAWANVVCTPTNNSIVFGNYDPLLAGTDTTISGSFQITCVDTAGGGTTNLTYFASLSGGPGPRQLTAPNGDKLNYNLYTDAAALTNVWGDGLGGTARLTGTLTVPKNSTVSTAPIPYYGRIAAGQDVSGAPTGLQDSQTLTITVTCQ